MTLCSYLKGLKEHLEISLTVEKSAIPRCLPLHERQGHIFESVWQCLWLAHNIKKTVVESTLLSAIFDSAGDRVTFSQEYKMYRMCCSFLGRWSCKKVDAYGFLLNRSEYHHFVHAYIVHVYFEQKHLWNLYSCEILNNPFGISINQLFLLCHQTPPLSPVITTVIQQPMGLNLDSGTGDNSSRDKDLLEPIKIAVLTGRTDLKMKIKQKEELPGPKVCV